MDTYECDKCKVVFEFGWSEDEARAEQVENGFGDIPDEDLALICDTCYKNLFN